MSAESSPRLATTEEYQPDTAHMLHRTLALLADLALTGERLRVSVEARGVRVVLDTTPSVASGTLANGPKDRPHAKYSDECALLIVELLEREGKRLVGRLIEEALGDQHGGSVIRHTLSYMVKSGRLTNLPRGDHLGSGYGLAIWAEQPPARYHTSLLGEGAEPHTRYSEQTAREAMSILREEGGVTGQDLLDRLRQRGHEVSTSRLNHTLADLTRAGLLKNELGRNGGYVLTDLGQERLREVVNG